MLTLSRAAILLLFCAGSGAAAVLPADTAFASEKIDINAASHKELQKIHGVGPAIASRIMEMRENCYFYPLSSLTEVRGIGETILKKIEEEGKAFVQPPILENVILCKKLEKAKKEHEQDSPETKEAEPQKTERVDINTASEEELQRLPGVGAVFAQKIIEARPFYSLDELSKVSGIGPKTLEKIKEQGLAWIEPGVIPPQTEKEPGYPQTGPAALVETVSDSGYAAQDKSLKTPSIPFYASALAILSGLIILILKKKLKNSTDID